MFNQTKVHVHAKYSAANNHTSQPPWIWREKKSEPANGGKALWGENPHQFVLASGHLGFPSSGVRGKQRERKTSEAKRFSITAGQV